MAENDTPAPPGPGLRSGRRVLVLRGTGMLGAGMLGAVGLTGCVAVPAGTGGYRTGISDSDPSDGPGQGRGGNRANPQRGTGITDADPNDGPGNGRGGRRASGVSDSDPNDAPGRGRGGAYRPSSTGRSDSDPNDAPGRGRGNVRRTSDSDPYDAAGQGRR